MKTSANDPNPDLDGTFLKFARDALEENGICDEDLCPYSGALDRTLPSFERKPLI
jgi:hypothetical protein